MKLGDLVTYCGWYGIVVKFGERGIPAASMALVAWHGSGLGPEWEFIDMLEIYRES